MNQAFEAKRPATAGTMARAKFNQVRKAEQPESIVSPKSLQVQRLRAAMRCSEATARTFARLIYGEGRP